MILWQPSIYQTRCEVSELIRARYKAGCYAISIRYSQQVFAIVSMTNTIQQKFPASCAEMAVSFLDSVMRLYSFQNNNGNFVFPFFHMRSNSTASFFMSCI